ncbi:putative glucan endo-1,3-beta-D-glucosidase [Helianthus annuus]|nr:putative glucan endo-1,3-beta-D-glucosidase [Helianthus annuus]
MFKMPILFLTPLFFLFICVSGQELLQISTPHQDSHTLGVFVNQENLNDVASTVLAAENWLRTHVLSYYPSFVNITSIVVSNDNLCDENQQHIVELVLFAMQNVHHSLVRWGLEKKIMVSVSFTPKCLQLQQSHVKRVLEFLLAIDSTYIVKTEGVVDQFGGILSSYRQPSVDLGVFGSKTARRMLPEGDYSVPSDAAAAPLPPLIGVTPPPMFSLPFAPGTQPPVRSPVNGAPPPYGLHLPPCNPYPSPGGGGAMAAPPLVGGDGAMAGPPLAREQMWCVAKPSVPLEKLQEAMDYACGEGGADCGPISPNGSCYFPDSVVAHASYAFNSYWQKNKKNGGTCGFGGTAMLISSDPSFLQCHFTLA